MPSPSGGESAEAEIAAAMRWIYSADMALDLAAQDQLFFDVAYNLPGGLIALAAGADPLAMLFEALAEFRLWYAEASPAFGEITRAAFPTAGAPQGSPAAPAELIEAFRGHAAAIASAWEGLFAVRAAAAVPVVYTVEHFRLSAEWSSTGPAVTVTLAGRTDQGGSPAAWPTLTTADGQSWSPSASPPPASPGSPQDGWYEVSHTFPAGAQLSAVSLAFGPLDVLERQSASISGAWVVRNADLFQGFTTQEAFIYRTQAVSFPGPIIPLIHRRTLPPVTPAASLEATLAQILTPIEQAAPPSGATLTLAAAYSYAVAPGGPPAQIPLLLIKGAPVTSPADIAAGVASTLAAWYGQTRPSTQAGQLSLAITLFGGQGGQGGVSQPLVQFDSIVIRTAGEDDDWWAASP